MLHKCITHHRNSKALTRSYEHRNPYKSSGALLSRKFSEGKSYTRANTKNKHKPTSKKSFREVEELKLKQNLWYKFKSNGTETDKVSDLELEFIIFYILYLSFRASQVYNI